jgi:hypothetical protein
MNEEELFNNGGSLLINVNLIKSFPDLMAAIDVSLKAREVLKVMIYSLEADFSIHPSEEAIETLKRAESRYADLNQNIAALKDYFSLAVTVEKLAKQAKSNI